MCCFFFVFFFIEKRELVYLLTFVICNVCSVHYSLSLGIIGMLPVCDCGASWAQLFKTNDVVS